MNNLAGKTILITRPRSTSMELIKTLEQYGAVCCTFACLIINPPDDLNAVQTAQRDIAQFDICIVTSVNAAVHCNKADQAIWIAIGPATAQALKNRGISCITPDTYTSEAILSLPVLQSIANKKIALFTGQNPKPLLPETLAQRKANLSLIYCYKRSCPHYSKADITAVTKKPIDVIIVSSSETLTNLYKLFTSERTWLAQQTFIVSSEAMQQKARQLGLTRVYQAADPSVASLRDCLLAITN